MIDNAIPHIVYDLSLPLEQRRKEAQVFGSIKDTADYLGISEKTVVYNAKPGKRVAAKGKEFAIRVCTKEVKLEKTRKYL